MRTFRITFLILVGLVCIRNNSWGQANLKTIKKKIPVEKVKIVLPTPSEQFYKFHTSSYQGLWDDVNEQIVIEDAKQIESLPYAPTYLKFESSGNHGVFNMATGQFMVRSAQSFRLEPTYDSMMLRVLSDDLIGFIDITSQRSFLVNPNTARDTIFKTEDPEGNVIEKGYFSNADRAISVGYGSYGEQDYWLDENDKAIIDFSSRDFIMSPLRGLIWEEGVLTKASSGEILREEFDYNFTQNGHFVFSINNKYTYLNDKLDTVYQDIPIDQLNADHFNLLLDEAIRSVKYIQNQIYLCRFDEGVQFYDGHYMKPLSTRFDRVIPTGFDFDQKGYSFFTVDNSTGYGLFNTWAFEKLRPIYKIIEKRLLPDGSSWYRADDELHKDLDRTEAIQREMWAVVEPDLEDTTEWTTAIEQNSMVVNHLSEKENRLILSPRTTTADTHDSYYYTRTNFEPGAGVYDLSQDKWIIGPRYHAIQPYKNHYVAMKIGSTYKNGSWLQTTIFDENFEPITEEEFGFYFIFNDMLLLRKGEKLVEYDIQNKRVKRVLGTLTEVVSADFQIIDGYLVISDNNYRKTKTLIRKKGEEMYDNAYEKELVGTDITDIVSPDGQLIKAPLKRYKYKEILGNDLVVVGKIRADAPTDRHISKLSTESSAVMDLKSGKIITPWYDTIEKDQWGNVILQNKIKMEDLRSGQ